MKKEGKRLVEYFPLLCDGCDPARRRRLGCGITDGLPWTVSASGDGHAGKALQPFSDGATLAPYNRTCPTYYHLSPFVQSVLDDLDDYEANRFGDVRDLPNDQLAFLRVASRERKNWRRYFKAELSS